MSDTQHDQQPHLAEEVLLAGGAGATDPAADHPAGADAHGDVGDAAGAAEATLDLEAVAAADPRSRVELLGELLAAQQQRDEYLDDLRRSHAEFDNYRKRVVRDGAVQRERGREDVVAPLLEVLDDLDRTLQAAEGSADEGLAKGVGLVAGKLVEALRAVGLERVDQAGGVFDPTCHEAVQQRSAEEPGGEPVVAQVLRPGYRLHDRTLRAAMVVVEQ